MALILMIKTLIPYLQFSRLRCQVGLYSVSWNCTPLTYIICCQSTRCHIQETLNLHQHCCKNPKCYTERNKVRNMSECSLPHPRQETVNTEEKNTIKPCSGSGVSHKPLIAEVKL